MTASQYQMEAVKTLNHSSEIIAERLALNTKLFHALIGISTEAGELQDAFKRFTIYGKELDTLNLKEELGDLMWYVVLAADALDLTLPEIFDSNIAKLRKRYPSGFFTEEQALNRNLEEECEAL